MSRDARSLLALFTLFVLLPVPLHAQQTAYWVGCEAGDVLRLELDDAEPGEYTLRLNVTDALDRTSLPIETDLRVR